MIKVYGKPIRVNKAATDKKTQDVGANLFIGNLDPDVDEKVLAGEGLGLEVFMRMGSGRSRACIMRPGVHHAARRACKAQSVLTGAMNTITHAPARRAHPCSCCTTRSAPLAWSSRLPRSCATQRQATGGRGVRMHGWMGEGGRIGRVGLVGAQLGPRRREMA